MARTSVSDEIPRIRLSNPGDLLSLVPYLLGFHPTDSLVTVGLRDERVAVTLRLDLPPAGAAAATADATDQVVAALRGQSLTGVVVAGYGDDDRVAPAAEVLHQALAANGLPVVDRLRAADGRYWSYLCSDPACCPPAGTPYGRHDGRVAAEATLAGLVALGDRDELAGQMAPVRGAAREAMTSATRRAQDRRHSMMDSPLGVGAGYARLLAEGRAAVRAAVRRYRDGADRLSDDEVAWLGVTLHELPVRDAAWLLSDDGAPVHHRALWTDVVRRVDPRYLPAPAALLGYVCWQQGDGGVAGMALARALDIDPSYRMAMLLGQVLAAGIPPSSWSISELGAGRDQRVGNASRSTTRSSRE